VNIVDIHPHVISHDLAKYPQHHLFDHVADYVTQRPITAEMMLAAMDEAGVAQSALVHSSMAYGFDDSYAADTTAAHPDRFAFVGSIDTSAPDAAQKLRYWVRERGMAGLRIFTSGGAKPGDPSWLLDAAILPVWAAAAELGVPVHFRVPLEGFAIVPQLLRKHPSLTIVLERTHAPAPGTKAPYNESAPFWALADLPNVYLKMMTLNVLDLHAGGDDPQAFLKFTVARFGAGRIAWGSNYSASEGTLTEILGDAVREMAWLTQSEREAIFGGTALRLYPALAARRA
jgi:predicted TIM-barrel fold metal-dependent hydrolase